MKMDKTVKGHWQELVEQLQIEEDPLKMLYLCDEITRLAASAEVRGQDEPPPSVLQSCDDYGRIAVHRQ
jgi:hypothetical protein